MARRKQPRNIEWNLQKIAYLQVVSLRKKLMLESVSNKVKKQSAIEPLINPFMEWIISQSPGETEFHQAAREVYL